MRTMTMQIPTGNGADQVAAINRQEDRGWAVRQIVKQSSDLGSSCWVVFEQDDPS